MHLSDDLIIYLCSSPEFLAFSVEDALRPRVSRALELFRKIPSSPPSSTSSSLGQALTNVTASEAIDGQASSSVELRFGAVELAREIARGWDREASLLPFDFTDTADLCFEAYMSQDKENIEPEQGASESMVDERGLVTPVEGSERDLDLTRLVMGNADMFLFKKSLFTQRIADWVKVRR